MKFSNTVTIAVIAGLAAATIAFWSQSNKADALPSPMPTTSGAEADAVFAGGCFWCVEADFDKVDGVLETISGYTGGHVDHPTYEQVSHKQTGHYESVRVVYDPSKVTYPELVDYFLKHIDPTDAGGQFCDRGDSYRSAIFVETAEERKDAERIIKSYNDTGKLPGTIVTKVIDQTTFWPAEDYHQNYYKTHPLRYPYYRNGCGRDKRVEAVWSGFETSHE